MPDHEDIYRTQAERYDALIAKQPNVVEVIERICPLEGLDIIDLGAGTGRLTVPIAKIAKSVLALDASAAMLEVTARKLEEARLDNWSTRISDHREIQAESGCADVLVSGWSISYVGSSNVENWERNIAAAMKEIERVLRPGGTAIVLETLGTGVERPSAPPYLLGYYALLEKVYGFQHTWIRTDYHFGNIAEAEQLTSFFFGEELAEKVVREHLESVPECAGIWWRRF
jgi:ubiquinone/menaquinone biosynthesis C-methylase UbiE